MDGWERGVTIDRRVKDGRMGGKGVGGGRMNE